MAGRGVDERTRRGWRWALIAVLFVYSCFPLAWSFLVHGTTPHLAGGVQSIGEIGGSLLLLSFPLAFVASGVILRRELRRRDEHEIEEQMREAQAEFDAREPTVIAQAMATGRANALQKIAQEIEEEWPGADLAGGTEAKRTMRRCGIVRRMVSELMEEVGDDELLERLRRVRGDLATMSGTHGRTNGDGKKHHPGG